MRWLTSPNWKLAKKNPDFFSARETSARSLSRNQTIVAPRIAIAEMMTVVMATETMETGPEGTVLTEIARTGMAQIAAIQRRRRISEGPPPGDA